MALAVVPALTVAMAGARPAVADTAAAPTCTFDGHSVTATYGDPGTYGIIASLRQVPSNGGELVFDQGGAVDCGATIHTAAKVVVNGTPTLDFFKVDESQPDFSGQLPPIQARLAGGPDVLIGLGIPNQVNTLVFGSRAMVINGTVVKYSSIGRGEVYGGNVDGDLLSGQGGAAAGAHFRRILLAVAGQGAATIEGGNGPDVLKGDTGAKGDVINGEKGDDAIQGSEGDDQIIGGPGGDDLSGSGGNDDVFGNGGEDLLSGDSGKDHLMGGFGSDELYAQDGRKEYVNGGTGTDTGFVDCGSDVVRDVEDVHC
jgi:Ca2+-binding RTX toxin-like protein